MTDRIQLPMPCRCSDESKTGADTERAKAMELVGFAPQDDFVSNMVMALWWNFDCAIDGVYCDMWFGVKVSVGEQKYWIPCDKVEDALATLYLYLVETKESAEEIGP